MKDYDDRRHLSEWFKCPKCKGDVRAMKEGKLCVSCQQKKDYRKRHPKEENGTIQKTSLITVDK